jgi:23S rRNA (cytidine1920-2'-O)/16S rRNA (cytidine1409-2'-O)-methyltransferase
MDIGAATGGFTDVLLRRGAAHVYAIDVGYGQLDWDLRNHTQVTVMERTNARYLKPEQFVKMPTLTVMDVSFISIRLILPVAAGIMGGSGQFYTLIKPQFEAGRDRVGKKGVVRDPAVHQAVLEEIVDFVPGFGFQVLGLTFSPITGPEGNVEFLANIAPKRDDMAEISRENIKKIVDEAHFTLKK